MSWGPGAAPDYKGTTHSLQRQQRGTAGRAGRAALALLVNRGYFFTAAGVAGSWKPGEPLNALTTVPSATFQTFTSPL